MTGLWVLALVATVQSTSLPELEHSVRADSNDALRHHELGLELARLGRTAEARWAFRQAVTIDPKLVEAWASLIRLDPGYKRPLLGLQRDRRGRWVFVLLQPSDSMLRMYRRVFFLNPLLDVISGERYPVPGGWRGPVLKAMNAFRKGDWEQAAKGFEQIIVRTTRSNRRDETPQCALWYHALTQVELGRVDVAVHDIERLLSRALADTTPVGNSDALSLQYALAYVHQVAGRLGEAARIYRLLLEDQLGLDLLHMRLAQVFEAQGRWEEAVAERRNAVNANPDDPSLIFDLGISLHNAGLNPEAEPVLQQALAANPREVRAHLMLGAVLQAQGKVDASRASYRRFLELSPRRYETLIADARSRLARLPESP